MSSDKDVKTKVLSLLEDSRPDKDVKTEVLTLDAGLLEGGGQGKIFTIKNKYR